MRMFVAFILVLSIQVFYAYAGDPAQNPPIAIGILVSPDTETLNDFISSALLRDLENPDGALQSMLKEIIRGRMGLAAEHPVEILVASGDEGYTVTVTVAPSVELYSSGLGHSIEGGVTFGLTLPSSPINIDSEGGLSLEVTEMGVEVTDLGGSFEFTRDGICISGGVGDPDCLSRIGFTIGGFTVYVDPEGILSGDTRAVHVDVTSTCHDVYCDSPNPDVYEGLERFRTLVDKIIHSFLIQIASGQRYEILDTFMERLFVYIERKRGELEGLSRTVTIPHRDPQQPGRDIEIALSEVSVKNGEIFVGISAKDGSSPLGGYTDPDSIKDAMSQFQDEAGATIVAAIPLHALESLASILISQHLAPAINEKVGTGGTLAEISFGTPTIIMEADESGINIDITATAHPGLASLVYRYFAGVWGITLHVRGRLAFSGGKIGIVMESIETDSRIVTGEMIKNKLEQVGIIRRNPEGSGYIFTMTDRGGPWDFLLCGPDGALTLNPDIVKMLKNFLTPEQLASLETFIEWAKEHGKLIRISIKDGILLIAIDDEQEVAETTASEPVTTAYEPIDVLDALRQAQERAGIRPMDPTRSTPTQRLKTNKNKKKKKKDSDPEEEDGEEEEEEEEDNGNSGDNALSGNTGLYRISNGTAVDVIDATISSRVVEEMPTDINSLNSVQRLSTHFYSDTVTADKVRSDIRSRIDADFRLGPISDIPYLVGE